MAIKATGNGGREKAPKPKSVTMFKGIKGLVASGPGKTKTPKHITVRPEHNQAAQIVAPFKK